MKAKEIIVDNINITIMSFDDNDYISLTDIAKYKSDDPTAVISNWMRNRNTIEYLGIWESLYNSDFNPLEFDGFRKQSGLNAFTLSPQKWIRSTNAIGIISRLEKLDKIAIHQCENLLRSGCALVQDNELHGVGEGVLICTLRHLLL